MRTILMCHPKYFEVSYDINPWMSTQIGNVSNEKAIEQWYSLLHAISKVAVVKILDGVENLPDLVFTANAGLIHNKTAVLSKFSKEERQPEEDHFKQWFQNNSYEVIQPTLSYEGEGDHLVDKFSRHWLGTGFRTDSNVAPELNKILNTEINVLELVDSRWYHLDTAFCPLPNGELLWYSPAFSEKSQKLIKKLFKKTLDISEKDALSFTCNCVCVDNNLYLPKNDSATDKLKKLGYNVHEFDLSEFMKAGGAAKCLTLYC